MSPRLAQHLKRALKRTGILLHQSRLFFGFDFAISTFAPGLLTTVQSNEGGVSARRADPVVHHTLTPHFDGVDSWGEGRYRMVTNSLGFKDETNRDLPMKSDTRRVLLIGDSFTEGIGLEFKNTFAGMLYHAGQQRTPKVEFLDAGVVSYSPTIYYAKIKHLLDQGLQFDEVVVLPDLSDIQDESAFYFCYDTIPEYRAHCNPAASEDYWLAQRTPTWWQKHLAVTDRMRVLLKRYVQVWTGNQKRLSLTPTVRIGWVFSDFTAPPSAYAPLGIEGGIDRARRHMQALADLLAARKIPLTVAVYPWPVQVERNDRDSRQVKIWREFCEKNCKAFINIFPDVFAAKDAHPDWYERYFIFGDDHYSAEGNKLLFQALEKRLLSAP